MPGLKPRAVSSGASGRFPLGTLAVNLSGALLLGFLVGVSLHGDAYLIAGTAVLGSYTTFSTWMLETQRPGLRVVNSTNASAIGRPDGRALFRVATPPRPDDRADVRGSSGQAETTAFGKQDAAAASGGGFDWTAAGTGAGAATALVLLLSWALMLRRNHRRASMPA